MQKSYNPALLTIENQQKAHQHWAPNNFDMKSNKNQVQFFVYISSQNLRQTAMNKNPT